MVQCVYKVSGGASFVDRFFHVGACCTVVPVPCSLVVTCWERDGPLAVMCVVFSGVFFFHFSKCVLVYIRTKGVGAVKYNILLTVPSPYFFCRYFMFLCLVFDMPLCVSVYVCLVVTC